MLLWWWELLTLNFCRLIMYVHLKYFEGYKIFFPSLEPPSDQEKVGRRLGQAGYPLQQVKSWKPFCRHPSRIALDPPAHLAIWLPSLHAGDCWSDSRRFLCRDVGLYARRENASSSSPAAGGLCGVPTVGAQKGPWCYTSSKLVLSFHFGREYLFNYSNVCSYSVIHSIYPFSTLVWTWQNRPCHMQCMHVCN